METEQPAVVLNVADMIDLAIGSPEVGIVDFNMLHAVLHCLAQQLRVLGKNVELRGSIASLSQVLKDTSQTVSVKEYKYDTEKTGEDKKSPRKRRDERKSPVKQSKESEVKQRKTKRKASEGKPEQTEGKPAADDGYEREEHTDENRADTEHEDRISDKDQTGYQQESEGSQAEEEKAGGQEVEKKHRTKKPVQAVGSKTDIKLKLKEELLPSDQQETVLVVERIKRSESPTRSLSPRKPSSSSPSVSQHQSRRTSKDKLTLVTLSKFNLLENKVNDLRSRVYGSLPKNEEILEGVRSQTNLSAITDMWTSLNVSSRLEAAEVGLEKLSSLVQDLITEGGTKPPKTAHSLLGSLADGPLISEAVVAVIEKLDNETKALMENMADLTEKVNSLMNPENVVPKEGSIISSQTIQSEASVAVDIRPIMVRLDELERRIEVCSEDKLKLEGIVQDQLTSFQDQMDAIHQDVTMASANNMGGKLSPDLVEDLRGLMELFQTVQEMQSQMNQLNRTASQLAEEKESRTYHMDALVEQIEILKNIKLDKEDMAEAMADKVDTHDLARKVSRDRFDAACDDLARQLETALGKLTNQEALWQQALDDIQREIENKLDKIELSPVKDFFNKKLQKLQEYLKQMASLRREVEAAGTKRKLLREVNCISCDAPAVMPMEASMVPVAKPLQPTMSMKPYLSYELDTIRKQQASNVPQRNMHDWEQIGRQMTQPKRRTRSATNKHICNRYCGGSHTVTTPAQRVARLGHFIKQWGPDVLPLSSSLAAGDDGKFYKVSTDAERVTAQAEVAPEEVCNPKPTVKHEGHKPSKTPSFGNGECHCVEKIV